MSAPKDRESYLTALGSFRDVLIHARELLEGCIPESAAAAKFRGRISQRWLTAWR